MLETFRLRLRAAVLALVVALAGWAQMIPRRPRITSRISESRLETLRNNVHPLARVAADRGRVSEDWPMERMLLVLQRRGAQESALDQFLEEQQDPESRQYHRWLTPEQFGEQFGANEADIRTVTEWLTAQGFTVNHVANGRTHIEFSGTAGQVEQAFHTELRKYFVNGQEHVANARDPQIPAALAPVVAGVATLHNFSKHSELHQATEAITATIQAGRQPQLTSQSGAHYLSPRDFALLYNLDAPYSSPLPAGATIALVGRSNINVSDVNTFRNLFGLPSSPPELIVNGPDPGNLGGGEEAEAVLDTTWAGAVAPLATVKLVVSKSTAGTDGVDLSVEYIIDHNLADIMSESFGECEANFTQAQATFYSNLAKEAAAQGITFVVASGDSGASGCDDPGNALATKGLSVNLLAATPYVTAGGRHHVR